ncbi:hypothetical protein [Nannocystis pusilla]|uniref:hypothetical protein n=1 Tax=Nannocystis pusilla TaxID=889268 RepID=UPI003BF2A8A7
MHVALVALTLSACIPSIVVGDNPQDDSSSTATGGGTPTGAPTGGDTPTGASTGGDAPTGTTSEPLPGVCGDGVVDAGEACDDGDADLDDGCAPDCTRVGVPLWTHTFDGPASLLDRASAVAFHPDGRVVVVGSVFVEAEVRAGLVLMLDASGAEVWKKLLPAQPGKQTSLYAVTIDDAGTIYAAGATIGLDQSIDIHAFDPAGGELWTFQEPSPPDGAGLSTSISELAVTADALFSSGFELVGPEGIALVGRRHQKDGGAVVWRTTTTGGAPQADGVGLAVAGGNVVVVGHTFGFDEPGARPIRAVFDETGGLQAVTVEAVTGAYGDVAAIGAGGDVVLVGFDEEDDVRRLVVRRLGPDGAEVWSQIDPLGVHGIEASGVAVGAGEEIVVTGSFPSSEHGIDMVTARFRGDGNLVWAATYDNEEAHAGDWAEKPAFGPDFVVVVGQQDTLTRDYDGWVRAYASE